jgi:hypothetical protein
MRKKTVCALTCIWWTAFSADTAKAGPPGYLETGTTSTEVEL